MKSPTRDEAKSIYTVSPTSEFATSFQLSFGQIMAKFLQHPKQVGGVQLNTGEDYAAFAESAFQQVLATRHTRSYQVRF